MGPRIGPIYTPESAEFPLGATPVLANLSQNGVHHFNVEGAAYHSTGHSAAWRCTLSAEKTGMRVQQYASDLRIMEVSAPSMLYPTDQSTLVKRGRINCPKVCWRQTGGGDAGGIEEKR